MRLVLFIFIFVQQLLCYETFFIKDSFEKNSVKKEIYFIKNNPSLNAQTVYEHKQMQPLPEDSLRIEKNSFWTRFQIKNNANTIKDIVIYKERTRLNLVEAYIYKNNKLIQTHKLGDLIPQSQKLFYSRYSLFQVKLLPKEEVTIVSYIQNNAIYDLGWTVQTIQDYQKEENQNMFFWGMLGGSLILAFFFNVFMYKVHNQKGYLVIAIHSIIFISFQYTEHGIMYHLDLGIDLPYLISILFISTQFSAIALALFPYFFFNMKKNYPKIALLFKFMVSAYCIILALLLYSQFVDGQFFKFAVSSILFSFLINSGVLFLLSVYMYLKKESGSIYYLFGQGTFAVCLMFYSSAFFGYLNYSTFLNNILLYALINDMILLMIAQYVRTRKQQIELLKNKELLLEQARFSSMGQAIGNITHQWKHPLAQVGSSVTLLEVKQKHKQKDFEKTFEQQLPIINNAISMMQKTLDEFNNFYSSSKHKENFNIYKTIEDSIEILQSKMILKNAQIDCYVDKQLFLHHHEHIFSNIFIILIDNSLAAFSKPNNNKITITIEKYDNNYLLMYNDNAGGIKVQPIEKVFDYFVSTKEGKVNQGMGLPILKMLVEEKLHGRVALNNTNEGVCFKIRIPLK